MSIYKNFCTETFDRDGVLTGFSVHCPENFNFGYDVVDRLADMTPGKTALVWCNTENEEHIFTFDDIKTYSNKMANVFRAAGIGRGDRVMVILKRHYEYWFAAIALHKLGAVMIPATHMLTVSDLVYRIEASRVKGIICTCQDQMCIRDSPWEPTSPSYIRAATGLLRTYARGAARKAAQRPWPINAMWQTLRPSRKQ